MSSRSRLKKNKPNYSLYVKHLPLLALAVCCFIWLTIVVTSKFPEEIANFLVPQLYLPVLLPFFLFVTFFIGYLTLNIKKGSVTALFLSIALLFRLQQIQVSFFWVIAFLIFFGLLFATAKRQPSKPTGPFEEQ